MRRMAGCASSPSTRPNGTSRSRARRRPPTSTPRIDESTNVVSSRSMMTASASPRARAGGRATRGRWRGRAPPTCAMHRPAAVDRRALRCARRPSTFSAPMRGVVWARPHLSRNLSPGWRDLKPACRDRSSAACGAAQRRRPAHARALARCQRRSAAASRSARRASASSATRSTRLPAASCTCSTASLASPLACSSLPSASRCLSPVACLRTPWPCPGLVGQTHARCLLVGIIVLPVVCPPASAPKRRASAARVRRRSARRPGRPRAVRRARRVRRSRARA